MPRSQLMASELDAQYGELLYTPPLSEADSAEALRALLIAKQPPIAVSRGVVAYWCSKYKLPAGAVTVANAQDLEERYGHSIRHLALEYPAAYKLCGELRKRDPPLCITDGVAKARLHKYARR